MRIAFLHPDLGIGGAEKLIINCALALQEQGHQIKIITPHYDPDRCLEATKDLRVEVRGSWFPRAILGRFTAFCSLVRMFLVSMFTILYAGHFDVIFVDQVSAVLPILKFMDNTKIVFYCHFPDKLLCVERSSPLKQMYRRPIDFIEEYGLGCATTILANSRFTRKTVYDAFPSLANTEIDVVHPCIELDYIKVDPSGIFETLGPYFFSINRYERKKNVALAIDAFKIAKQKVRDIRLLIGGGYDTRLGENIEYYEELKQKAKQSGFSVTEVENYAEDIELGDVVFMRNLTDYCVEQAYQGALATLYTPENEHFGIIPIDSMLRGTPVIACNSGGPLESMEHGISGFLLEQKPELWAEAMVTLATNSDKRAKMSYDGSQTVKLNFSMQALKRELAQIISK